jgi:hypothetical protein
MSIELLGVVVLVAAFLFWRGNIKLPQLRKTGQAATATTTPKPTRDSQKWLTASNLAFLGFVVLVAAYIAGTTFEMGQLTIWVALAVGMFLLVRVITPGPVAIIAITTLLILYGWFGPERSEGVVNAVNSVPSSIVNALDGGSGSSINVLCQDENGRALPRCEIVTLSSVPIEVYAPPLHCVHTTPGGTSNYTPSSRGVGWWNFTSKTGEPVTVGIFKPRVGDVFFGSECI